MKEKRLIKSFGNFEAKIENAWKQSDFFRNRLSDIPKKLHRGIERRWKGDWLFEQRKQLFNSYQKPIGGGLQPKSLTSEVQRLVAKRFQNIQEWRKERERKEELEQEQDRKLISGVWNKENNGDN